MTNSLDRTDAQLVALVASLRSDQDRENHNVESLASVVQMSPLQLREALDELQGYGYELSCHSDGRVLLVSSPDRMIDTEILPDLQTTIFARQLHCYGRIRSTNMRARELAEGGAPEGTIVVAEEQTGGRGRFGRSWHSLPRLGIWSSVVLRPPGTLKDASGLSLLASLAFAETTEQLLNQPVQLKWPNDGLIDGKKIFGVLTEVTADEQQLNYAICGTGINVNHMSDDFPDELQATATSLAQATGRHVDRLAFYRTFLETFDTHYQRFRKSGIAPFLPAYRERSIVLGREVTVTQGKRIIVGTAVAINNSGALIVNTGDDVVVVFSGEATLRT